MEVLCDCGRQLVAHAPSQALHELWHRQLLPRFAAPKVCCCTRFATAAKACCCTNSCCQGLLPVCYTQRLLFTPPIFQTQSWKQSGNTPTTCSQLCTTLTACSVPLLKQPPMVCKGRDALFDRHAVCAVCSQLHVLLASAMYNNHCTDMALRLVYYQLQLCLSTCY